MKEEGGELRGGLSRGKGLTCRGRRVSLVGFGLTVCFFWGGFGFEFEFGFGLDMLMMMRGDSGR